MRILLDLQDGTATTVKKWCHCPPFIQLAVVHWKYRHYSYDAVSIEPQYGLFGVPDQVIIEQEVSSTL